MNKNYVIAFFVIVAVSAGALGYWFGYNAASTHRFVPYSQNINLAFDSRTGQICFTKLPEPQPLPTVENPNPSPENANRSDSLHIPLCTDLK